MQSRYAVAALALTSFGCSLMLGAGCPVVQETHFLQTNLVTSGTQTAAFTDANLINPWGLIQRPNGPFWVADNGTGVATVYDGTGQPAPIGVPLVVTIPVLAGGTSPAPPTGIVFNSFAGQGGFESKLFIFVTEDGTIAAWGPNDGITAVQVVDNSKLDPPAADILGAVYKGATIITNSTGNFLLAANFRDARIDVFDTNFMMTTLSSTFTDNTIPTGFAPFNVLALNGKVYVTYAKQDDTKHDDVGGAGNGFVNEFDTNGALLRRIATAGALNSPWGMAIGPSAWGNKFSGSLLVGNFGDGKINSYTLAAPPVFQGALQDDSGADIVNPGLWSLVTGDGTNNTSASKLYFTAGGEHEDQGLFGSLQLVSDTDLD